MSNAEGGEGDGVELAPSFTLQVSAMWFRQLDARPDGSLSVLFLYGRHLMLNVGAVATCPILHPMTPPTPLDRLSPLIIFPPPHFFPLTPNFKESSHEKMW